MFGTQPTTQWSSTTVPSQVRLAEIGGMNGAADYSGPTGANSNGSIDRKARSKGTKKDDHVGSGCGCIVM